MCASKTNVFVQDVGTRCTLAIGFPCKCAVFDYGLCYVLNNLGLICESMGDSIQCEETTFGLNQELYLAVLQSLHADVCSHLQGFSPR